MFLQGFGWQLLEGVKVTLAVSLVSIALGLVLGIIAALGELSHYRWLKKMTFMCTATIRGLPELLTLFALYFGGTLLLTALAGHYEGVDPFAAGVLALGMIFGAYASEVLRGALLAIPLGQWESATALGLQKWMVIKKIILPQVWRHALPGLGNLVITTLKDSSLVALIGLSELTNQTQLAANETHQPFTFYFACAFIYLVLTSLIQIIFHFCYQRAIAYEH